MSFVSALSEGEREIAIGNFLRQNPRAANASHEFYRCGIGNARAANASHAFQSEELRGTRGGIRYGNLSFEHTEHRAKRGA